MFSLGSGPSHSLITTRSYYIRHTPRPFAMLDRCAFSRRLPALPWRLRCYPTANSEIGQNVTNAAAGKKPEGDASSSGPPPPVGSPFSKLNDAREAGKGSGSRKVDDGMVQSGVIDVESED